MKRGILLLGLVVLTGCPKSSEDANKPAPSASVGATPSATISAAAAKADASTPSTSTSTGTTAAASYSGTYSLVPGAMYIPPSKDWSSVKQAKDDPSKHVGDGTLTLSVDASGHVTGTIEAGPAAPAVIDGSVVEGEIRGVVRRKDPADEGLTGTIVATVGGDGASGKLSLAESNAAIVREGKLSLKKK